MLVTLETQELIVRGLTIFFSLQACSLDPILDDSVEFARRLRSLEKDVELYILEDLPHGFLSFHLVSQDSREGNELCIVCLKRSLSRKRKGTVEKPPVY